MSNRLPDLHGLGAMIDRAHLAHPGRHAMLAEVRERVIASAEGPAGLRALGEAVDGAHLQTLAGRDSLREVRARLLRPHRPRPSRLPPWTWAGPIGALAVAAILALALRPATPAALGCVVEGEGDGPDRPVTVGREVEGDLRFSDGSSVALRPGARARVLALRADGAEVQVARGEVGVHVVPARLKRWTFHAGPFEVHVLGTRFVVGWDPDERRFSLSLQRGKVRVEGPGMGSRTVRAGESVSVSLRERRVAGVAGPKRAGGEGPEAKDPAAAGTAAQETGAKGAAAEGAAAEGAAAEGAVAKAAGGAAGGSTGAGTRPGAAPEAPVRAHRSAARGRSAGRAGQAGDAEGARGPRQRGAAAMTEAPVRPRGTAPVRSPAAGVGALRSPEPPPAARHVPAAPRGTPPKETRTAAGQSAATPSPIALARAGRHTEALAAAAAIGWSAWMAHSPPPDLVAMGDAARFARDFRRAAALYAEARGRGPGTDAAAVAALALGRLAFDRDRDHQEAARWLRLYLAERPQGPLAREASGRLLEALIEGAGRGQACEAAARHLERWSSGRHADLARDTLAACHSPRPEATP